MAEIITNPPSSIAKKAKHASAVNTFTNPNQFSSAISNIDLPGLRYIIPFHKTAINILKYSMDRTPFAFASRSIRNEIKQGGAVRDMALGRIATGTFFMLGAMALAVNDRITGGAPSDPELRQIWLQNNQPYSIKFKDEKGKNLYIAYNRFEPIGNLLSFGADVGPILFNLNKTQLDELAIAAIVTVCKNTLSKTYLQSVTNVLAALDDPDRKMKSFLLSMAAGFVPNVINTANKSFIDPYRRTTKGQDKEAEFLSRSLNDLVDKLKTRIPGESKDLPPLLNLWGQVIENRPGFQDTMGQRVYNFLSPAYAVFKEETDPVNKFILENNIKIQMPRRFFEKGGAKIPLSKREYYDFVRFSGRLAKKELDKLVKRNDFKNADLERKEYVFKKIISKSRLFAQGVVLEKHPELLTRIEDAMER
jgi:hypothetical protein